MTMDPDNPIIARCVEGMAAEADGRDGDARDLFARAWEEARDDYEACVAAHYVARHQDTPADRLRWNAECLARAERAGAERTAGFLPSLHVNLASAHADLGDPSTARGHYRRAAGHLDALPPGPYRDWARYAIAEGLRATVPPDAADGPGIPGAGPAGTAMTALVDALCERRDHVSLALLLPAYVGDLGTDADRAAITTALHMLHASPGLPSADRALVRGALATGPANAAT